MMYHAEKVFQNEFSISHTGPLAMKKVLNWNTSQQIIIFDTGRVTTLFISRNLNI
jgi:hypothetical protein